MSEEEQESYFFQVIIDQETDKPQVLKLLKPPSPVLEVTKSDDPKAISQITVKEPELTDEQKETYKKQNEYLETLMKKQQEKYMEKMFKKSGRKDDDDHHGKGGGGGPKSDDKSKDPKKEVDLSIFR